MKKIIKIFMLLVITIIVSTFYNINKVNAVNVNFYDYKDINILPTKYSYGTLFYTENTKIEPISYHWQTSDKKRWGVNVGEEIKLKITNCAVDEDNDLCDVIITINNVKSFKNYNANEGNSLFPNYSFNSGERMVATIAIMSDFLTKDNKVIQCNSAGDLILFNLNLFYGTAEFTMDYYKAETNTRANINGTIALVFDIDIYPNSSLYASEYFNGREGLSPLYESNVYYQKSGSLATENGGIAISKKIENINYLAIPTSCFVTQSQKSTYSMKYGGSNCGILYCFASPYAFEINNPNISVDKNRAYEGEKFIYTISQYVPNNYYAGIIGFLDGYSGLYSSFKIEDIINSNLTVLDGIKVVNENGIDVTSYFNINVNNNKVTATLKNEYLNKREFYSHIYKVQVPVKFNTGVGKKVESVLNNASTTVVSNNNQTQKFTSDVSVGLKYDINTMVSIDGGSIIIGDKTVTSSIDIYKETLNHSLNSSIQVKFKADDLHDINSVSINGENIDLTTLNIDENGYYIYAFNNDNVTENINQSIEVSTTLIKGKAIITKVDKNDNTKFLSGAIYKIEKLDNNGNIDNTFTSIEKTTEENGKVEFNDLSVGKYRITEIKAPDGYELNSIPVEIIITKDIREQNIVATDRLKLILPQTGGNGLDKFCVVGSIIIIISIILKRIKVLEK